MALQVLEFEFKSAATQEIAKEWSGDREAVQLAAARHSLGAVVPYHQRLERESEENAR